jgi:hypothetical protein
MELESPETNDPETEVTPRPERPKRPGRRSRRPSSRDRFHKTLFRPKSFWTYFFLFLELKFHPKIKDKNFV